VHERAFKLDLDTHREKERRVEFANFESGRDCATNCANCGLQKSRYDIRRFTALKLLRLLTCITRVCVCKYVHMFVRT